MLADSITLTAGTITVRAEDGRMLVHTLDTPLAELHLTDEAVAS